MSLILTMSGIDLLIYYCTHLLPVDAIPVSVRLGSLLHTN